MNNVKYFIVAMPLYVVLTFIIFSVLNYFFVFENQFFRLFTIISVLLINMFLTRIILEIILPPFRTSKQT